MNASPYRESPGFTQVDILVVLFMLVMTVLLLLLGSIRLRPSNTAPIRQTCAMNIEAIEGAKQMWMLEFKKDDHDIATKADLKPILKDQRFPVCPNGGAYTINANDTRATCSLDKEMAVK